MKTIFVLLIVSSFLNVSLARNRDTLDCFTGKIFEFGEKHNRQVFLKSGDQIIQLTHFKHWERISELLLSRDGKLLLIRHIPDKIRANRLTILDLTSRKIVNSIQPGTGGDLKWTNNDCILLIYGCGCPCVHFQLFDKRLNKLADVQATYFCPNIEQDVIVSCPVLSQDEGKFNFWSLTTGKLIATKSYTDKYGLYYFEKMNSENGQLLCQIRIDRGGISDSLVTLELKY